MLDCTSARACMALEVRVSSVGVVSGATAPHRSPSPLQRQLGACGGWHGACAPGFTSVRPPYYPTALVATTERPRTEQWMAPKGRERSMTYYRRQREYSCSEVMMTAGRHARRTDRREARRWCTDATTERTRG
eukprot:3288156-Prymnesium_polylepis.1